jgi:hypothetical protein
MSFRADLEQTPAPVQTDRRDRLVRDLTLALVDQRLERESAGFNPYDAQQGQRRQDNWEKRRR